MSKMNKLIFTILHVIAWIIFVGLCIEAGALIVNFVCSVFKPEVVGNLYQKLDVQFCTFHISFESTAFLCCNRIVTQVRFN